MTIERFDLLAFLIWQTPGAALLLWGLFVGVRPPSERSLGRWAARYGLALTAANQSLVAAYRRRTRSLQLVGAGVGWLAVASFDAVTGLSIPLFGVGFLATMAGYFLGAVVAETTFLRPFGAPSGIRSAVLVPRDLLDYLPSLSIWALRGLPLVMIGLAVVYVVMPKLPPNPGDPSLAFVIGIAAFLTILAVGVDQILRTIVGRPQPVIAADLVAADDALRASSIHVLAGASIAMLLVGIGGALFWLGYATPASALSQPVDFIGTIVILLSIASWVVLGHPRSWRVRHGNQLASTP
ncbi:MAG TPA: hypothetical protein VG104_09790 [Candidatus Dormibacteraeota bacterium]|jgi:hypothetical protein|nr:hypothetical protein [Candidatus Dormibacteraeota bacterium]